MQECKWVLKGGGTWRLRRVLGNDNKVRSHMNKAAGEGQKQILG